MKIAIIGGGLAGLATAYYFLESGLTSVSIFEQRQIAAGASGVCSGLLHPYVGLAVRRSQNANEALSITKTLLRIAEKHSPKLISSYRGILRKSMNAEQRQQLLEHCTQWGDVEQIDEDLFLIHCGITVHSNHYLEGLMGAIQKRGGELIHQKIHCLEELKEYDQIIIAAGYGITQFPECAHLKVKYLKGQILHMEGKPPLDRSFISKGYIAHLHSETYFEVGSTYEKHFSDTEADVELVKDLLQDKLLYCPDAKIIGCKAGIRVCPLGHYIPIIEKIAPKAHVFTGLGSRGLLYHGYYGRKLVNQILSTQRSSFSTAS